jgi:hypothetical protein
MNERFNEFAKQAGINLTPAQFSGVLEDEVDEFELEKFAELIVRECAGMVENQGRYLRYDVMSAKIKEHFGIK